MSSEPNPKMDDLLKRYVRQRKGEARADFELHPATRNLLQSEVARTFPRASEAKKKSWVFHLWPRLAIGGAFTAMLVATVLVLNKPKERGMEVAQSSSKEMAAPSSPSRPSDQETVVLSDRVDSSELAKAKIPAASPAPVAKQSTREPEVARRSGAAALEARSEATRSEPIGQIFRTDRKLDSSIDAPAKTFSRESIAKKEGESTPAETAAQDKIYADMESQNRWRFVQQDLRAKYRQNFLSPAQPKILQSFELVQTGNKIRLVDADGSIYDGEILTATEAKLGETDLQLGVEKASQFAFRVSGTNQTLNRVISLIGEFVSSNEPVVGKGKASVTTRDAVQFEIARPAETSAAGGFIHGKVSIAGTNEFEFRATTELSK